MIKSKLTFQDFKKSLMSMIEFEPEFDEEAFHDWYIEFKESTWPTIRVFANEWFSGITFKTHTYRLRK